MSPVKFGAALAAVLLSFSCGPPKAPPAAEGDLTLEPEGGQLEAFGVKLDVPAGAVSQTTHVKLIIVDEDVALVEGRSRASLTYRFEPEVLLGRSLTLTVPFKPDRVTKGVDLRTLDLRRRSVDESANPVPYAETDMTNVTVVGTTDRLSTFWVTAPVRPVGLKIVIKPDMVGLEVGGVQKLDVSLTDAAGTPVDSFPIHFEVIPPRIARVDVSTGTTNVIALAPGRGKLRATAGPARTELEVNVLGHNTGPTVFQYDNPFPTGNDLWAAAQLGGESVFAGAHATVLELQASGQWARLATYPDVTLMAIDGPTPKTAVAVGVSDVRGVLFDVATGKGTFYDNLELHAVSYDGTTGLAAGQGSDVLSFSAGKWSRVPSPTAQAVLAIRRDPAGFTVVGNHGSMYQIDTAGTWHAVEAGELAVQLDFAVFDSDHVWAVGAGYLWEWALAGWTARALPDPRANLTALGMLEGQLAFGADDGRIWVRQGPDVFVRKQLRGPQVARGIHDGFIVGDHGALWQSFNGSFSELSRGFYGDVVGLSAATGVVVAAVVDCSDLLCTRPVGHVMQRIGPAQWQELGDPFMGGVSSIIAFSPTEIYVGGPGVQKWDGTRWYPVEMGVMPGQPPPFVSSLAFCSNRLVAASGTVVYVGLRAGPLVPSDPVKLYSISGVACSTVDSIWKAGPFGLFENDQPRIYGKVLSPAWEAVWSPAPNEAFVFGPATYGGYWNGEELLEVSDPGGYELRDVGAIWGPTIDQIYIAGATWLPVHGYIARFDGLSWEALESGAQRPLKAIGGTNQLWVGGLGGAILRGVYQ